MTSNPPAYVALGAFVRSQRELARLTLRQAAELARISNPYLSQIEHYVYAGDNALHVAAAAYRPVIVRMLVELGADVGAKNRRGAEPLHYAADGSPWGDWDSSAQGSVIAYLIASGADPNAFDNSGVAALHRAVRTRG